MIIKTIFKTILTVSILSTLSSTSYANIRLMSNNTDDKRKIDVTVYDLNNFKLDEVRNLEAEPYEIDTQFEDHILLNIEGTVKGILSNSSCKKQIVLKNDGELYLIKITGAHAIKGEWSECKIEIKKL